MQYIEYNGSRDAGGQVWEYCTEKISKASRPKEHQLNLQWLRIRTIVEEFSDKEVDCSRIPKEGSRHQKMMTWKS